MSDFTKSEELTRIALIGYRCTGKTTVGIHLAEFLGWSAIDLDRAIEARAGMTIGQLFSLRGEPHFRDLEANELQEAIRNDRAVIATGGGIVMLPSNVEALRRTSLVLWLLADVATIWDRMQRDEALGIRRPQLTCGGKEEIETLLARRSGLYRECAHHCVETNGLTAQEVCDSIIGLILRKGGISLK